jgi:hypothetical protein
MNLSEVSMLLGFASFHDLRINVDEFRVRAWHESLDEDLTLVEAKKLVSWFYANHEAVISPAFINKEFRRRRKEKKDREESRLWLEQQRESEKTKAPEDVVKKYLSEIRQTLNRGNNASMEKNNGEVASDL